MVDDRTRKALHLLTSADSFGEKTIILISTCFSNIDVSSLITPGEISPYRDKLFISLSVSI